MKRNRIATVVRWGVMLVIVAGILFVVQYLHDRGINYPTGGAYEDDVVSFYEIAPTTILQDLHLGKTSVFKPTDLSSITTSVPSYPDSFSWHQSDYLLVSDALNQSESKDASDWKIYGMIFHRGCQDGPLGFDDAEITYFRYDNQQNSYRIHQMDIYPGSGFVSFMEQEGFQRPFWGWKSIKLHILFVSADAALQKGEELGGKQFRSKLDNACHIIVVSKPSTGGNNWRVSYLANHSADDFDIYIDLYTGWYKVSD